MTNIRHLVSKIGRVARRTAFALACTLAGTSSAFAQDWTVDAIEARKSESGQPVNLLVAAHLPPPSVSLRHVVVYPQPSGRPVLKQNSGTVALGAVGPWVFGAKNLAELGVAIVYLDAPPDAAGRILGNRPVNDVKLELQAGVDFARKRFPGVPVHLGAFGTSATLLEAAARVDGVSRIVFASGVFLDARALDMSIKTPVMLVHAPSNQCDPAPFLEAEQLARRHRFALVQAGYAQPEARPGCGRDSHHQLRGLESEFAQLASDWFEGKPAPSNIGVASASITWREQVVTYPAPGALGMTNQLELTLLLPDGPGPFPVVVYNHGDVDFDHPALRHKRRFREMAVSREFLRLGMAVAIPARRGVGLSEGTYPKSFLVHDADPTYKARVHAEDIVPALKYLGWRPEIDANRIVLAGHSAGGYSAIYLAGTNLPGVIGAVDFAGGRTDSTALSGPGHLNKMMVDGFAEFGRSTRVPTLWVFAENDSRYTSNTIRAAHAAFVGAGGKARLSLSPPIPGDGHFVHEKPDLWRVALKEYLAEIGVTRLEYAQTITANVPSPSPHPAAPSRSAETP